tara:strand:- start:40 stop:4836 length:4797 start_codon:yes stop_codon:yes gene_type:complete
MEDSDSFIISEDMDQIIIPENENIIYEYKIESLEHNDLFLFIYKINDDYKEILCSIEKIEDDKLFLKDNSDSKTYGILLKDENTLILKTEDYEIIDIEKIKPISYTDFDKENNLLKLTQNVYPNMELNTVLIDDQNKEYSPFIIIEELISKLINVMDISENDIKIISLRNTINNLYQLSLQKNDSKELYQVNNNILPKWLIPFTTSQIDTYLEQEEIENIFNENNSYSESMHLISTFLDRFKSSSDTNMVETINYHGIYLKEDNESNLLSELNARNKQIIPFTNQETHETNFQEVSSNEKLYIHGLIEEPQSKMLYSYNIDTFNTKFTIYEKSILENFLKKSLLNQDSKIPLNIISRFIDKTTLPINLENNMYTLHRFNTSLNESDLNDILSSNIHRKVDILKYILENNPVKCYNLKDIQKLFTKYNIHYELLDFDCKNVIKKYLNQNIDKYLQIYSKKVSNKKRKIKLLKKKQLTIEEKSKLALNYILKIVNIPIRNNHLINYINLFTRSPKKDEDQQYLYNINNNKKCLCKHYLYLCKSEDIDIFKSMISIFGDEPDDGNIYCKVCNEYLVNEEFSIYEGIGDDDKPLQFRAEIDDSDIKEKELQEITKYLEENSKWVKIIKNICGSLGYQFEDNHIYEIIQIQNIINNDILANKRYQMLNVSDSKNHPFISDLFKNYDPKKDKKKIDENIQQFQKMLISNNQLITISCLILFYSQTSIPSYYSSKNIDSKLLTKLDNCKLNDINSEYIKIIISILTKYSQKYPKISIWQYFNMFLSQDSKYKLISPIDQFKYTIMYLISPQFNSLYQRANDHFNYIKLTSKNYTKQEWSSYKPLQSNKIISSINTFIQEKKEEYYIYYLKSFKGYLVENISLLSPFDKCNKPIYKDIKLKVYKILNNQSFLRLFRYTITCYGIQKNSGFINNQIARFLETTDKKDSAINIFTSNGWNQSKKEMDQLSFYKIRNNIIPQLLQLYIGDNLKIEPCFNNPQICNNFIHQNIQNYDSPLLCTYPKRHYFYKPVQLFPSYEELNKDIPTNKKDIVQNKCKKLFSLYKYNFKDEIDKNIFNDNFIYFSIMKYLWNSDIPEYIDSDKILNFNEIASNPQNLQKIIYFIHKKYSLNYNLNFLPHSKDYFNIESIDYINQRFLQFYESYSNTILSSFIQQDIQHPIININDRIESFLKSTTKSNIFKDEINSYISDIILQNHEMMKDLSSFITETKFLTNDKSKRILNLFKSGLDVKSKIDPDIFYELFERIFNIDCFEQLKLYMKEIKYILSQIIISDHKRNYTFPKEWKLDESISEEFNTTHLLLHNQYFIKIKDSYSGFNHYKDEIFSESIDLLYNELLPYFENLDLLVGVENTLLNKTDISDILNNIFLSMLTKIINIINTLNQVEPDIINDVNPLFNSLQMRDYEKVEISIQVYSELLIDLITNMFYEHFDVQWIYENKDETLFQKRIAKQKEREKQTRIKKLDESTTDERYITMVKQAMGQSNWYKEHAEEASELVSSEKYADLTKEEIQQRLSSIYDKYLDESDKPIDNPSDLEPTLPLLPEQSPQEGEFTGESSYDIDDFDEDKDNTENTMYGLFDEEQELPDNYD